MLKILDGETEEPVDPQVGYIDGYNIADRLLEGVMFKIAIKDGEVVCEGVAPGDREYCEKFSDKQMKAWCDEAVKLAHDDVMTSFDGSRDLFIEGGETADNPQIEVREVKGMTFDEVLEDIKGRTE